MRRTPSRVIAGATQPPFPVAGITNAPTLTAWRRFVVDGSLLVVRNDVGSEPRLRLHRDNPIVGQVLTSGLGCLSIAVSSDGKTFAGGVALFQDAADAAAFGRCGAWVEDRPPRLQRLMSLELRPTD